MSSIIDQIADDLNVSRASVSRALNDRPGVGDELRARILQRAKELKYTPSIIARGLATSQTFALGFFVHEKPGLSTQTDPFYGEILRGVEQVCARSDYHVTIATLTENVLSMGEDFRFVRERRIDGMILAGPDIPADFIVAMLRTDIPVVLVDNCLDYSLVNCVNSDDEGGAFLAAHYLLDTGHREIGIIAGPEQWASNRRRVNGFMRAMHDAGLSSPIVHADRTTIESGQSSFQALIQQHPSLTAVCAANDSMAIGAIRAARSVGRNVPDDLSVVGFDDIDWAELNDPPLTTIQIPKLQMGKEAASRLIALIADPELLPTELTISVQLVKRGSSRAFNNSTGR
jgi:LacI family transcriptional regulator